MDDQDDIQVVINVLCYLLSSIFSLWNMFRCEIKITAGKVLEHTETLLEIKTTSRVTTVISMFFFIFFLPSSLSKWCSGDGKMTDRRYWNMRRRCWRLRQHQVVITAISMFFSIFCLFFFLCHLFSWLIFLYFDSCLSLISCFLCWHISQNSNGSNQRLEFLD